MQVEQDKTRVILDVKGQREGDQMGRHCEPSLIAFRLQHHRVVSKSRRTDQHVANLVHHTVSLIVLDFKSDRLYHVVDLAIACFCLSVRNWNRHFSNYNSKYRPVNKYGIHLSTKLENGLMKVSGPLGFPINL